MRFKTITKALLVSALLLALPAIASAAGHIAPTGVTTKKASQLIVWYDESQAEETAFEGYTLFQVTNANTTTGVNIHVQIFADNADDSTDLCREHDFTDTLTPMDTVLYVMGDLDNIETDVFGSGTDFGGNNAGALIPIDVDGTRGFIVVTSVDTVTLPRQAISHNYLFGSVTTWWFNDISLAQGLEAMGREAVNVATGALAADGTILDGINNALRGLQPSFIMFDFNDDVIAEDEANVVSIAFSDNYSDPSGEYRAVPATAVWDPLMFDQFENGTSCQQHIQTCFVTIGINDDWNTFIDENGGDFTDVRLCPAVSIDGTDGAGWVKIAISGLSGSVNNIGALGLEEFEEDTQAVGTWMFAE